MRARTHKECTSARARLGLAFFASEHLRSSQAEELGSSCLEPGILDFPLAQPAAAILPPPQVFHCLFDATLTNAYVVALRLR